MYIRKGGGVVMSEPLATFHGRCSVYRGGRCCWSALFQSQQGFDVIVVCIDDAGIDFGAGGVVAGGV